jgi:uncharacterized radical SAM superfamily Fe-S cluster-containing enzyme
MINFFQAIHGGFNFHLKFKAYLEKNLTIKIRKYYKYTLTFLLGKNYLQIGRRCCNKKDYSAIVRVLWKKYFTMFNHKNKGCNYDIAAIMRTIGRVRFK